MTASPPAGPVIGPAGTCATPAHDEEAAIRLTGLTKRYGRHEALSDLDLEVRRGEVFGFIGPNGAGKTTAIRLLLDLIRPTSGSAKVLGLDAQRDGVAVRRRVGYLPGELALYEDLTARQQLEYLAALRGAGARAIEPLASRLSLELDRPIRALSKGNRQKVGLVQALMHDPVLLILDEPTGGLDPLVQREFRALLGEFRARRRTVFLSSHVLSEVDRVADRIGLIREGRLLLADDVEALRARVAPRLDLRFDAPPPPRTFADLPGVAAVEQEGARVSVTLDGPADAVVKRAARFRVLGLASREPDLDDLFLALMGGDGGAAQRAGQDPA